MKTFLFFIFSMLLLGSWSNFSVAQDEKSWEQVVDRVASSVLAIRVDGTRDFDTGVSSSSQATGFVIDAERGIVLTNRHVVQPGPAVAKGVFLNREEIKLIPIYRDPIHDFGFFKYDPKSLSYNEPVSLELKPERVQLGRNIRVIGNDGGEQLSILAGTISRLDRPAPAYGTGKYNDFNTFYIQAASSTSGGSSGAPVIDIDGNAIALNAGANAKTASSFFLPLDRVVSAYEFLKQGEAIPRGTLQTTFKQKHYDELKRLGLSDEAERQAREDDPQATGLLTVDFYMPEGPADGRLEAGDILLKIDGKRVRDFVTLEAVLDSRVNEYISMTVERAGQELEIDLTVQNLTEITPASYIQIGGGILHDLSYQQARSFYIPVNGVYVAKTGYMFGNDGVNRGDVLTSIAAKPVNNLEEAEAILKTLADDERFSVRFFSLTNPRQELQRVLTMDRQWFEAETCHRDDESGLWPCDAWEAVPAAPGLSPRTTGFSRSPDPLIEKLAPSMVVVDFDMPYPVEGVNYAHYIGSGLIVDAERGWVLVDRNTVPSMLGDVYLTFAESIEVPGKVEFIHPNHNFAIVSYDPKLIGNTAVKSAVFSTQELTPGDDITLIGPKGNHRLSSHKTTVADVDSLTLSLFNIPAFRDSNLDVISLTSKINTVGGVLVNEAGEVAAVWNSLQYQNGKKLSQTHVGMPAEMVLEMLDILGDDPKAEFRAIEAELQLISLAEARKRGLPEEWAANIERHNPKRRSVLYTIRLVAGTPAADLLKEGDMILAIDGKTVNTFREVERAAQAPMIKVSILRRGQVRELILPTQSMSGEGLTRVVNWAGAMLHRPHRAIAAQRGFPEKGLYVSWTWSGSAAAHYGLRRTMRLVELEGYPISDIDSFFEILEKTADRKSLRLKVLNLVGKEQALTLKPDYHYWPTVELVKTEEGWQRRPFHNY